MGSIMLGLVIFTPWVLINLNCADDNVNYLNDAHRYHNDNKSQNRNGEYLTLFSTELYH